MRRLEELTESLLAEPLALRPSVAELGRRNRRRRRRYLARATGSLVVAAGLTWAGLAVTGQRSQLQGTGNAELAAYIATAAQVPDQVLDEVGLPSSVAPPRSLTGQAPLAEAGKPLVVFLGAGYCPFCAVERWALVIALSKFGRFSKLGQEVSSASTDVYPGLKSWSFQGSSYSSPYLSFAPADTGSSATQLFPKLQPPESEVFAKYDVPPYTVNVKGAIPFVDMGNRYLQVGASASASVLEGLSLDQIASNLVHPASPVAKALDGAANYLIATFCSMSNQRPSAVCSLPTIVAAQARLGRVGR